MIALTQMRRPGRGQEYFRKRIEAGDTKREAIRALRRRISDEVFRRMRRDETLCAAADVPLARAA